MSRFEAAKSGDAYFDDHFHRMRDKPFNFHDVAEDEEYDEEN
jgi:hypothetical protein